MSVSTSRFTLLCFLLLAFALLASAQEATVVGTVTDPSGAPVPNVAITITHKETGVVRHITTNDVGQYVAPDIHIGHVDIRCELSGFRVAEQKDVVLQVGERDRVDFKLEIGATTESVNVEATALAI